MQVTVCLKQKRFRRGGAWLHQIAIVVVSLLVFITASRACQAEASRNRDAATLRLETTLGHTHSVNSAVFSPDGRTILTVSNDTSPRLWETVTGRELRRFEGHVGEVNSAVLSEDGRTVLTASDDTTARLWETVTGRELRRFEGHSRPVNSAVFSPDGRTILTGSNDGTARTWDMHTGEELRRFEIRYDYPDFSSAAVFSAAFSADGRAILTASGNKSAYLWDAATGHELRDLGGGVKSIISAAFSPNGRTVLTKNRDNTARLLETATGRELQRFQGHGEWVISAVFSPDGHTILITKSNDMTPRLWETSTGRELQRFEGHVGTVSSAVFSADGRTIMTASSDKTARLWDIATGRELQRFEGHHELVKSAIFSPDERAVLTTSQDKTMRVWERATGRELQRFKGHHELVKSAVFSPDGHAVLTTSQDKKTMRLWDMATGGEPGRFREHAGMITSAVFSPDGRTILTASRDKTARLWERATGLEIRRFKGHSGEVYSAIFSPDGRTILTASEDETARLWEGATGRELQRFEGHKSNVYSAVFSPDGRTALTGSADKTARLWNISTGREIRRFGEHYDEIYSAVFSPDGRTVLALIGGNTVRLWEAATGLEIRRLKRYYGGVYTAVFSPDSRTVLITSGKTVRLEDMATGRELQRFEGHGEAVIFAVFSPDGRIVLTVSLDKTTRMWDAATGEELVRLVSFSDGTWAAVDREGRFDGSNGGDIAHLYWVAQRGEELESISLSQLKERYYEPGLLAKKLGLNAEPLRDVEALTGPKLHPRLTLSEPTRSDPVLRVALFNRGGGIGRVVVFVNGKEMAPDVRPRGIDPAAQSLALELPMSAYRHWLVPGQKNRIEVLAYNAEGYLASRKGEVLYQPEGKAALPEAALWAIIVGVSDYAGGAAIDLRYAAKDAEDVAKAIELGGRRLFGAERVRVKLLSTSQENPAERPTKANIKSAFEALADVKPNDIVFAYFSGHGVAVNDIYHFPTQEASSTNLDDPAVREQRSVSSNELAQWLRKAPAQHQVMILDTCAAGLAANSLVQTRNVPADQVRALERLKDRMGVHVLMGSASDRVSYEATRFEQGLMTHALLRGMKGEALREDAYVDVSRLFNYVADEVPRLAADIGGIQRPYIVVPTKSTERVDIAKLTGAGPKTEMQSEGPLPGSFDIGQLNGEDRAAIPIRSPKPLLLRPTLLNEKTLHDDLGLEPKLRALLREAGLARARGAGASIAFVEADELPGAINPSGLYTVSGDTLSARLVLRRDGQTQELQIDGTHSDLDAFTEKMMQAIVQVAADWK